MSNKHIIALSAVQLAVSTAVVREITLGPTIREPMFGTFGSSKLQFEDPYDGTHVRKGKGKRKYKRRHGR